MKSREDRKKVAMTIVGVLFVMFASQAYMFISLLDVQETQQSQYNELTKRLDNLSSTYNQEIQEVRRTNNEKLERMGEFVIETREKYKNKTDKLMKLVEKTERENNIKLREIRQELQNLNEADVTNLVNNVIDSAVSVSTNTSEASGAIITDDNYVVTNYHVVKGYENVTVIDNSGKESKAKVVATQPVRDLAILKAQKDFESYIELGDSDEVLIGEKVIAIGSPEGLEFTVTQGIVSATDRVFKEDEGSFIQTDVPINTGSSGGPLVNTEGKVIGINTFKLEGSESLGFAIPSNDVKELLEQARS